MVGIGAGMPMFVSGAWLGSALLCGSCLLALVAMYTDARRREIPNWPVAGIALLWAIAAWLAPQSSGVAIWAALACGLGGLAAGYAFHALGWLGGGDGKLLGVLALWMGPKDLGLWLLATALLGLLLVLLALGRRTGDLRIRGIPFAWAMAPPAAVLLVARAVDWSGA